MNKTPMTKHGAELLRQELEHLKKEKRPAVVKAIAEARSHGDLKENAEYHAAKEQQGFLEGRIAEIESKLSHAQIIDVTTIKNSGNVIFGATVKLTNLENNEDVTYKIVGDDEADLKESKISVSSPISRAIIGRRKGDFVVVQAPVGEIEYEIKEVLYLE